MTTRRGASQLLAGAATLALAASFAVSGALPARAATTTLSVTKYLTAGDPRTAFNLEGPVSNGGNLGGVIIVQNIGEAPATNVVVTDAIPPGWNVNGASWDGPSTYNNGAIVSNDVPNGGQCHIVGSNITCNLIESYNPQQSLPVGGIWVILLNGSANCGAGSITNTASASADNAQDPATGTSNTMSASCPTDMAMSKQVTSLDPVENGDGSYGGTISWAATATNIGASDANGVVITDQVPSGVTVNNINIDPGSCTTLSYTMGGATTSLCTNCSSSTTSVPGGATITCAVSGSVPDNVGGTGSSVTMNLEAEISQTATSPLVNTASVSASNDNNPTNNSASTTTPLVAVHDLVAGKNVPCPPVFTIASIDPTSSPTFECSNDFSTQLPSTENQPVNFSLNVANHGPANAGTVYLVDALPVGLQYNGVDTTNTDGAICTPVTCGDGSAPSASTGLCGSGAAPEAITPVPFTVGTGDYLLCTFPNGVASDGTAPFSTAQQVMLNMATPPGWEGTTTSISNSFTISSQTGTDPDPDNNNAEAGINAVPLPNMSISKAASTSVTAGTCSNYFFTVQAANISSLQCDDGSAVGSTYYCASGPDPVSAGETCDDGSTPQAACSDGNLPVSVPADSIVTPTLTDRLPEGVTAQPAAATATFTDSSGSSAADVTCTGATETMECAIDESLPPGSMVQIEVPVCYDSGIPDGTTLSNNVSVSSDTPETTTDDNSYQAKTVVNGVACVVPLPAVICDNSVSGQYCDGADVDSTYSGPGSTRTSTISLFNNGPSDAVNPTFTISRTSGVLPDLTNVTICTEDTGRDTNGTLVEGTPRCSAADTPGTCQTVDLSGINPLTGAPFCTTSATMTVCTSPPGSVIPPGGTDSFTFNAQILPSDPPTSFTDTVTVSSDTPMGAGCDNSGDFVVPVGPAISEVCLDKAPGTLTCATGYSLDPATGQCFVCASGATPVPDAATGTCGYVCENDSTPSPNQATGICGDDSTPVGVPTVIGAPPTAVLSTNPLTALQTNPGETTAPDISFNQDGTFSYTIALGTPPGGAFADATNAVLTDLLPVGLVPTSAVSNLGACNPSSSLTGSTTTLTGATATASATNPQYTITCDLGTIPGNNPNGTAPQVVVTVTGTVAPNAVNLYGPGITANGYNWVEQVPNTAELSYDTPVGPVCALSDQSNPQSPLEVQCTNGAAPYCGTPGATPATTCALNVEPVCSDGSAVLCPADETDLSSTANADLVRPVATPPPPPTPSADLRVSKVADQATAAPGATVHWTITVTNDGPGAAADVRMTDLFATPAHATVTGIALTAETGATGALCTLAGGVTCTASSLASGGSITAVVTGTLATNLANGTQVANTARVTSSTAITTPGRATDTATVNVAHPGSESSSSSSGTPLARTGASIVGLLISLAGIAAGTALTSPRRRA